MQKGQLAMICILKGNYKAADYQALAQILRDGLSNLCSEKGTYNCENCRYYGVCRDVSQAITFSDKRRNELLARE